jgi:hypothetical protein
MLLSTPDIQKERKIGGRKNERITNGVAPLVMTQESAIKKFSRKFFFQKQDEGVYQEQLSENHTIQCLPMGSRNPTHQFHNLQANFNLDDIGSLLSA